MSQAIDDPKTSRGVSFDAPCPSRVGRISVWSRSDVRDAIGADGDATVAAMVEITSPDRRFPPIDHGRVEYLLRLKFEDVLAGDERAMTAEQASDVVRFVRSASLGRLPICPMGLVVSCDGGVSRSGGVAAGLADVLWGDGAGDAMWRSPALFPNERCWRLVREAAGLETTDADVARVMALNREAAFVG